MKRIPELDGLRALAVGMVVIGHSMTTVPERFAKWVEPVSFLGDDGVFIFFVLSGFLITSLLVTEQARTGRISKWGFYARRTLRIFPAYYAFLGVIAVLGLMGLTAVSSRQLLVAALYLWNYGIFLGIQGTPEDIQQGALTLGHCWSLALEEQFYWIWPAVLTVILPVRQRCLILPVILLVPVLRVLIYFVWPDQRGVLGLMFHTGIDVIAVGAALALYRPEIEARFRSLNSEALVSCVLFLLVLVVPLLHYALHGLWTITYGRTVDALLAAFVILAACNNPKHWYARWLRHPVMQFGGRISFSLYLWQQIFCLTGNAFTLTFPLGILPSIAAATASYYLIEQPFLRLKDRKRPGVSLA